jgi:hypothetical protein
MDWRDLVCMRRLFVLNRSPKSRNIANLLALNLEYKEHLMKQRNEGVLYYSRNNGSNAPNISNEVVEALFSEFSESFRSPAAVDFYKDTRVPNERELYGLLVKAVFCSSISKSIGYLATELNVGKEDDSKGRTDLFFNYRNTSFIVEFKVARIRLRTDKNTLDSDQETQRVINPWNNYKKNVGVVYQLKALDANSISQCLDKKVVKLPLVLYLYIDWRDSPVSDDSNSYVKKSHKYVMNQLRPEPHYERFDCLANPLRTRKRKTSLNAPADMNLYRFSLVASALVP